MEVNFNTTWKVEPDEFGRLFDALMGGRNVAALAQRFMPQANLNPPPFNANGLMDAFNNRQENLEADHVHMYFFMNTTPDGGEIYG